MDDEIKKKADSMLERGPITDRPGFRIYLVRLRVPEKEKVLNVGLEVEDAWVTSEQVRALAERDGLSEEETYAAVAVDSARMRLSQVGFSEEQLRGMRILEVRRITAQEATELAEQMAAGEGS